MRINCDNCGRFISKSDIVDGRCSKEDVSDGLEYGEVFYAFTCPKCKGEAYAAYVLTVPNFDCICGQCSAGFISEYKDDSICEPCCDIQELNVRSTSERAKQ